MGTSRSAAELADKFGRLAAEVPHANRDAVNRTALLGKEIMLQGGVKAGLRRGGNLPSSSRAKWGARYDIKGTANPSALLRYTGPVHWAFGGTQDHVIGARRRGTRAGFRKRYAASQSDSPGRARTLTSGRYGVRAGRGALALRFGGRFALYAKHPGSRGRNTWPETRRRIADVAPREFHKAHRDALRRARF